MMRARRGITSLLLGALIAGLVGSGPAYAYPTEISFFNITNNNATDAATAGQYKVSFTCDTSSGSERALFTFKNLGPSASSITDVYFDDGTLLSIASVQNSTGVDFSQDASPGDLPGGNSISPAFNATAGFTADSNPPTQPNGVNPSETLGILFNLQSGKTCSSVDADLASGALRIGIHVQGFAGGGSESFVNNPPPPPDTGLPICFLYQKLSGPPAQLIIRTQDTGSGLKSIQVTTAKNVDVVIPPFTVGTTQIVDVTATKIDQSKGAQVALRVTDVAGNYVDCDPVHTLVVRNAGKPVTDTFTDLPQAESKVVLTNGTPGVQNLDIVVNGTTFKVVGMQSEEVRSLSIASAMRAGNANTVSLTAYGQPGASVEVLIHD